MRKQFGLFVSLVLFAASFFTACGGGNGGGGTPPSVSVSISPSAVTLQAGGTQQFTATVTGTTNTSVTWSATCGTVSASGFYTAPSSAMNCAVTVTSKADQTKSASASVTVTKPPQMTIAPATATVLVGSTQQFTTNMDANWSVNDIQGGNSTLGTIGIFGLYTAPPLPPNPATVTVKAVSRSDSTNFATATVTVVAGHGSFAWLNFYAPQNGTAAGKLAAVTGNGNVVAGVEVTPAGDTDPHVALVTYREDGSLLGVWTDPDHSSFTRSGTSTPTAMTYDPVSGNVFAVGYAGDSVNLDAHAALLLITSPSDPTNVVLNKTFQLGGMRTEARAVSVQDGKIYIAAQSAFKVCNPIGVMGCTGNWVVVTDMQGNIVLKFGVGGGDNTFFNGYRSSISGVYVSGDHLWVVGDDINTTFNAVTGYYFQEWSSTGLLRPRVFLDTEL
jgi:hypothetical protein